MQMTALVFYFGLSGVRTYQMFVRRPRSHGPNVLLGLDVREPGLLDQGFENGARTRVDAEFSRGNDEFLVESFGIVFPGERVVRRPPFQVEVDEFDPSAWLGVPDKHGD